MVSKKFYKTLIYEQKISEISETDIFEYTEKIKKEIKNLTIKKFPIKLKILIKVEFLKIIENELVDIIYSNPIEAILSENNLKVFYTNLIENYNKWLDSFQERGSGFTFNKLGETTIKIYNYNHQKGSSYIPLEFKSKNIINIRNLKDNKCFLWCLIAKLFPTNDTKHKERLSNYKELEDEIIMDNIKYPVKIKDIPKIEKMNNLTINVFGLEDEKRKETLFPIFISNYKSDIIIDLLYLENEDNTHFVLLTDLDSFLVSNRNKQYVCRNCLQTSRTKEALNNHRDICLSNKKCRIIMPKENQNILKFTNHKFSEKIPFAIYSDFESSNKILDDKNKIMEQKVNSYGLYIKSHKESLLESQYLSYIGNNAQENFVKKIIKIFNKITFAYKKPIIVPVYFHNGSGYDFHFIIEELMKYENDIYSVKTLSKSTEEYISIEYGNNNFKLRFLDSYRFFTQSLSNVAKSLVSFPILSTEFEKEDIKLLSQKGFYPYEYVDSLERLKENKLPERKDFYSTLTDETISEKDYLHAQKVWNHFKCKSLLDYHKLYLKTDVLILADAFEEFRNIFLKFHNIDPCYCYSSPGLSWQCGLKYTQIELELITDYDMLQMFEKGIKGGFSGVLGPRYVKAYNKQTKNYFEGGRILDSRERDECLKTLKNGGNLNDLFKEKYLLYLDANNLYGWAMSQKLPVNDFRWEGDFDYYKNIPEGRGCLIECDLD